MIAAVQFRNFKALRAAEVRLAPFNLLIGPNGSGKTSLIQSLLRLRTLAGLPVEKMPAAEKRRADGPVIEFTFQPPHEAARVRLSCVSDLQCDLLQVDEAGGARQWNDLRARLRSIRAYLFDHYAMAMPAKREAGAELASNAGNLAAVLASRKERAPEAYAGLEEEFRRLMPEFSGMEFSEAGAGQVAIKFRLADGSGAVDADSVSQGTLYLLAILSLAFDPAPPAVVCLEEADRGVHPRMLREVRDALYRLSYPQDFGLVRAPVQVLATTHSPYLLDLFKEHPEEIILANKRGNAASFERLSDRPDILELTKEAHLGDLWYSGILGGVPGAE